MLLVLPMFKSIDKIQHYFLRSSPKCWCKLNSANLSFHKLKHTGFFRIVIFFNPVVNGHV
ncbi:hypothetical protein GA741_04250 [Leuconostoc suionicum]|nr:hypothetical protein [Leuconostoc suionicum]